MFVTCFRDRFRYEDGSDFLLMESDVCSQDTEAYVTNLSYYHLVPFETDILDWPAIAADYADGAPEQFFF